MLYTNFRFCLGYAGGLMLQCFTQIVVFGLGCAGGPMLQCCTDAPDNEPAGLPG